ncbi:SDR family NAD(P)-dependent oxidoreductase [Massilia sp. W12]|uniref:SDR family NAD(P)-dependent oxidoreductase n=1 Tax=Massilia sp. W12 TaxID=3126507 RepID=UPI0030CDCAB0
MQATHENKLMVISGASRGMGAALSRLAKDAGWQVYGFARSQGGNAGEHWALDLAKPDQALPQLEAHLAQLAQQPWSEIAFINNAGVVGPVAPAAQLADAQMLDNIAINFTSGLRVMAAFMRHFQGHAAARKVLLSVSSGAALRGYGSWAMYCAAKAGLENYVRSLAAEQQGLPHPVLCVNFGPGVIDTDMQAEIRATPDALFADVGRFRALKEQGQLRSPENVAQALLNVLAAEVENGGRYVVDDFDQ